MKRIKRVSLNRILRNSNLWYTRNKKKIYHCNYLFAVKIKEIFKIKRKESKKIITYIKQVWVFLGIVFIL